MKQSTYYIYCVTASILVVIWPPLVVLIIASIFLYRLLKKQGYIQ